uniref:Uncharacterized protein n=1 Tax=Meloidogyne enterolobii TaxID=390850 RepID=A0A6V7W204_MELEN|nr:unnamed protein product [Meloidogyne enterolobii]
MLFDLYSTCNEINQVEQNFFILWHLFGFARKLLRLFISSSNHINFYDNLLSEKGEKISIIGYMKAYDTLELRANYVMDLLEKMDVYNIDEIQFCSNENEFTRHTPLTNLKDAEYFEDTDNPIIYPAIFSHLPQTKEKLNIEKYLPLNYTYKVPQEFISQRECSTILNIINNNPKIPFYVFYSFIPLKVQQKIEFFILNTDYLTNLFERENEGKEEHEYLDENIYLEIRVGNNKTAIPHPRGKLLNTITQYCIGLINQQSSGHQGETSGGNFGDTSGSEQ